MSAKTMTAGTTAAGAFRVTALIAGLAMGMGCFGSALAQDRNVPAGDSLEQTPPPDVTKSQIRSAPPEDRSQARALERQGAVKPTQ